MGNTAKTALLLGLLSGLLLFIGELFGGAQGLVVMFGLAAVMNFVSYWFSDRIVLRMYNAQEVGAGHLYDTVARLARQANLPMPRVYVLPTESPNAFATGRSPKHAAIAATQGILRLLDQQELDGVLAHELAHVKHRDTLTSSVAATIAAAIMMAARMAGYAAMFGGMGGRNDDREGSNPLGMLLMVFLAPIASLLIQSAISRSREFSADASGAAIAGTPYGLADALRKIDRASKQLPLDANPATAHLFIVKPFSLSGMMSLFSTHPPTEQRIERLLHAR